MATHQILLLIGTAISAWIALCWLDTKYQMRFVAWMNGECSNPFQKETGAASKANSISSSTIKEKDEEIAQLKERVQTLEKIVTEPAYELNKKLNRL
jgi:ABC-type uncharacterized transport system fused permease/ATPase subunit